MDSTLQNDSIDLQSFIRSISVDDIQDMFSASTFYKGQDYYHNGRVKTMEFKSGGEKLVAGVQGTHRYEVTFSLDEGNLMDECSCPIGGGCKHVVAALIHAALDADLLSEKQPENRSDQVRKYLANLPHEDLVDLVCRFAPEKYINEISNKFSGSSEALSLFRKVEKDTLNLLDAVDYGDRPDQISAAIGVLAAKLAGLENHLKPELERYIFSVIYKVDELQGEGYLYDDYHDDCFEGPEEFTSLVRSYVSSLQGNEKTIFLRKLDAVLSELGHSGFGDLSSVAESIFETKELPGLKSYFIQNHQDFSPDLAEKYYSYLDQLMTGEEKELILSNLKEHHSHRLIELSELYNSTGRKQDSIEMVEKWLSSERYGYRDEKVYIYYIDLVRNDAVLHEKACTEAITNCPGKSVLKKIQITMRGNTSMFEKILEEKNPGDLLDFLEDNRRLHEAMELIKRSKKIWSDRVAGFYRKHKEVFKDESIAFFSKIVKDNLPNAGDSYYHAIVNALREIKQLDKPLADNIITEIKTNYNRRRNLMAMLDKIR